MHNSQNGLSTVVSGPTPSLLNNNCVGCHSGTNAGNGTPFVFNTGAPIYGETGTENSTTTLAGGSFYWVNDAAGGDAAGHNVEGLASADATFPTPPGFGSGFAAADGTLVGNGGGWPANTQVTCAGVYGCHGTHDQVDDVQAVKGGHHSAAHGSVVPGSSPTSADSYRMLVGIAGYEDSDWEYTVSDGSIDHNQYKGVDGPIGTDTSTIGYLCGECHGQFHQNTNSSSPWLRHPTDFDMANSTRADYAAYNGGTGANNPYSVITPVASVSINAPLSVVTPDTANDDTIVTCISCHRAHGTPYYKSLRWDYANGIGGYCTNCHTSKN
jgi:predicted CXXCH cytochrome family protein